ncbi:MAG: RNA polymerase sigma factor [Polyangiales bacterium]
MLPSDRIEDSSDAIVAGDDERLVRAAAAGDREALGQLYDRFAPSMLAVAQRILGSAREAEDVVHDVFLEAWHRAGHYDRTRGSVRTWLMLRLRSRSLDRVRAARRAAAVALEDATAPTQHASGHDAPAQSDGRALRGVLAGLPQEQRVVLELSYFEGYSCSQIAARLDVPIGTVKSRMSRALSELRTRFVPRNLGGS